MKKIYIRFGLLLVLIMNVLTPIFGLYTALASEEEPFKTTLIAEPNLVVDVEYETKADVIHWKIQYEMESMNEHETQKLKVNLTANGEALPFLDPTGWQLDTQTGWLIMENWQEKAVGELVFQTTVGVKDLLLEFQQDTLTTTPEEQEAISESTLPKALQGPYVLSQYVADLTKQSSTSSEIIAEEETTTSTQMSEESSEVATSDSTNTEMNEPDPDSFSYGAVNNIPLFPQVVANFDYSYADPFDYVKDQNGTVPNPNTNQFLNENNIWSNEASTTSNFDYGATYSKTPPTTNIIGGTQDFFKGYHTYTDPNSSEGQVLTKKTVSPLTNPNEFEIQLDLIGDVLKTKKSVDIMFVVDRSSSMTNPMDNETRWKILKRAMASFTSELLQPDNDIRMGLVGFGTEEGKFQEYTQIVAVWAAQSQFGTSSFTRDPVALMQNPLLSDTLPPSATPTYLGVELGAKVLKEEGRNEAEKFLIVLTDGTPTYSQQYIDNDVKRPYGIAVADKSFEQGLIKHKLKADQPYWKIQTKFFGDGNIKDTYTNGFTPEANADRTKTYINKFVYNDPVVSSFNKYAIGFGIDKDDSQYTPGVLAAIAGQGHLPESERDRVLSADNASQLESVMDLILRDIIKTTPLFSNGVLIDPMSEYVKLLSDATSVEIEALSLKKDNPNQLLVITENSPDFPTYAQAIKDSITIAKDSIKEEIRLSDMNLGGDGTIRQGIRLKYKVQLKEEYRDGKFYPANGPTSAKSPTFSPSVGFAVPSVRSDVIDLGVEKQWIGDGDYQELRQDIVLQLQRKESNGEWSDVQGKTIEIKQDATDLTGRFDKLPATREIVMANGKASALPYEYRVVEVKVPGYDEPEIITDPDKDDEIIVKNKLLTTDLVFTKVNEAGENLLGAEFTLFKKQKDGTLKEIKKIENPSNAEFLFEKLPIGEYLLKETKTPEGFRPRVDIPFQIIEELKNGKHSLKIVGLPDDFEAEGIQIKNSLDDFHLSILKMDQHNNQPLADVVFSLSEKGSDTVLATATSGPDGVGFFKDSSNQVFIPKVNQSYVIKETQTKDGYVLAKDVFELTIAADGTITLTESGQNYDEISSTPIRDQQGKLLHTMVQLKVWNKPKGLLPSTGGLGRQKFVLVAAILAGTMIVVGGFYTYRNRKGVH